MILLDPDLDPGPPSPGAAQSSADRLPSARTLAAFLARAQAAVRLRGQVSVLLTTDRRIRRLNRQFRGKNKATDVLSFPAEAGPERRGPETMAGDLAVSVETARKQAAGQGHALAVEVKVLLLHGLLHLAGYDHETDAGEMARRERLLRGRLKLPLGLIERTEAKAMADAPRRRRSAPAAQKKRTQKPLTGSAQPGRSRRP